MTKPLAALSLDLDNHWSYLKTHGDSAWESFPSYFDRLVPPLLDLLDEAGLRVSFFVVGQDAVLARNGTALRSIADRGHDIGNHSFHHEPWLGSYSLDAMRRDVADAERAIADATGRRPVGFRGPGFSWSPALVDVLAEAGYLYDATTLPTFLGPLGRMYYFARSGLDRAARDRRKDLYGNWSDGLRPVRPFLWLTPSGRRLLEIPVTTVPLLKIPFHLSYLIYIARFSEAAAAAYLGAAVRLCRLARTGVSFLLHPLDFLGPEDAPGLSFFPGMDVDPARKRALFRRAIAAIARVFEIVDLGTYARSVDGGADRLMLRPADGRRMRGEGS
jgi:hypothetical protein